MRKFYYANYFRRMELASAIECKDECIKELAQLVRSIESLTSQVSYNSSLTDELNKEREILLQEIKQLEWEKERLDNELKEL